jgi:UDP-N-acetylglucosamine--N-acetylmuramyl-(pentapeptide) pyrophosphoryl-undecaprenol N-acetylglucosamine transferase
MMQNDRARKRNAMEKEKLHIVFTGGGSLGPVTPLIAVMRAFHRLHPDAVFSWIGTKGGIEERIVTEAGLPFRAVRSGKLRRYFSWQNLSDPFITARGFFEARKILADEHADAVVSAGGFVAVPVAWAAWTLGIPVHVHQQDVRPGLANRLTLPVATSMSVALESSVKDFLRQHPTWTGNPVRPEILGGSRDEAKKIFRLEDGVPVVLILGGGTGATGLNALVWKSLQVLVGAAQVIHVAGVGKTDAAVIASRYHQSDLLTENLPHAFAAADVVVSRAGMGTLTELAGLRKPTIIVPMPDSHQAENAAAFARAGAVVLDERTATSDVFVKVILGLLTDASRREASAAGMARMNVADAAERIARMIEADVRKK